MYSDDDNNLEKIVMVSLINKAAIEFRDTKTKHFAAVDW